MKYLVIIYIRHHTLNSLRIMFKKLNIFVFCTTIIILHISFRFCGELGLSFRISEVTIGPKLMVNNLSSIEDHLHHLKVVFLFSFFIFFFPFFFSLGIIFDTFKNKNKNQLILRAESKCHLILSSCDDFIYLFLIRLFIQICIPHNG